MLSPKDDFFNLSKNIIKSNTKIYLDIKSNRLKISDNGKEYFFINAKLKNNFDDKKLLDLVKKLQNYNDESLLLSGGAIYAAIGKINGQKESVYLSSISLFLSSFLLIFVFRKIRILFISLIAVFGLVFGLAMSFLLCQKVHILSIVVSSSLVGLMFDFAIHYLSFHIGKKEFLAMRNMLKVFLIGLFVTTSGYIIFAFAPLDILKQISIFGCFALIGAFFATYFLLPTFLSKNLNVNYKTIHFIEIYIIFMRFLLLKIKANFILIGILILGILILSFMNLDFKDDIRSYANTPKDLSEQAKKISIITGTNKNLNFLVLNSFNIEKEQKLIKNLKEQKLILDQKAISDYILSQKEQNELKEIFRKFANDKNVLAFYANFGFDENFIKDYFLKLANCKTISTKDLMNLKSFDFFQNFIYKDKSIIYGDFRDINKLKNEVKKYNASYFNFVGNLNASFDELKVISIELKLIAFLIAFLFLAYFYKIKKSAIMIGLVLLSSFLTLSILTALNFSINIFSIFGLILSSAIGIDYMIFALNDKLSINERVFGIVLASLTTMISFLALAFSSTLAIEVFGLSVGISVFLSAVLASLLSINYSNNLIDNKN